MPGKMPISPLSTLRVSKYQIPAWQKTPNTSIQHKPLMIYHEVFLQESASIVEKHLRSIGVVEPRWRYTMYSQSHFHSTSHEVLCITSGSAKCCFGHEDNPGRIEIVLSKGDVVVVPAGVSHGLLQDYGGFQMIGSYPIGKNWDMCYGEEGEEERVGGISELGWFTKDPLYGIEGPCIGV